MMGCFFVVEPDLNKNSLAVFFIALEMWFGLNAWFRIGGKYAENKDVISKC